MRTAKQLYHDITRTYRHDAPGAVVSDAFNEFSPEFFYGDDLAMQRYYMDLAFRLRRLSDSLNTALAYTTPVCITVEIYPTPECMAVEIYPATACSVTGLHKRTGTIACESSVDNCKVCGVSPAVVILAYLDVLVCLVNKRDSTLSWPACLPRLICQSGKVFCQYLEGRFP